MEGRAIARPNMILYLRICVIFAALQWRAGQLPGQTPPRRSARGTAAPSFNGGPGNCPAKPENEFTAFLHIDAASMEGRAIARPNGRQ